MRHIVDPKQSRLFDSFSCVTNDKTSHYLLDTWEATFRACLLEVMPVDLLGESFDEKMGRPTKELYSMAGLMLLTEYNNWTKDEALAAYRFHMDVHFALNLEPVVQQFSMRSLERYIVLFEKNNIAQVTMEAVSNQLVQLLDIQIDQQRLDSTHVFSDMASFGRTRLMGVAIKRFLTQLKRHDPTAYNSLNDLLRQEYVPGVNQLFADTEKTTKARRLLRQEVAEDMHELVQLFACHPKHSDRKTYKAMARIFYEQCDVHEEKVSLKKKTGSDVMQNPSDPDATYDGHKGQGYQVQLSETCNSKNEVQLITSAIVQTASESDMKAVEEVLEDLESHDLLPEQLLADAGYTSDENVLLAEEKGVELVGPVPGKTQINDENMLSVDDFNVDDETEEVVCCPAGYEPESSEHDKETGQTKTVMPRVTCSQCEYFDRCPIKKVGDRYHLKHTAKERRVAGRRKEQKTDVFRERYKKRGGIEGTNSCLKRKTGLGQLRVRGKPGVSHAIYLKIAGWNISRAMHCAKMRKIVYEWMLAALILLNFVIFRLQRVARTILRVMGRYFVPMDQKVQPIQKQTLRVE